jgi:ligand-binding sensor domain-containing protein
VKKSLFISLVVLVLNLPGQQYNFHNYSVKDGVAQSQVYSLLQDSRGYLWMGTQGGGVTRYDGKEFKTYSIKEGLSSNKVFCIREDKKKNLWFGTMNGLSHYNGNYFRKYLPGVAVREIDFAPSTSSGANKIWLASDEGLLLFEDSTSKNISSVLKDKGKNISTLLVAKDGSVWYGSDDAGIKGLYNLKVDKENYSAQKFDKSNGFTNNVITCIKQDAEGKIWIGTYGDGAYVYDNKNFFRIDLNLELYKQTVLDIYFDNRNNVWLTTLNSGVFQYNLDTRSFSNLTTNEGLSNNHVHCAIQDKSGNYWFGTSGGGACNYFGKQFTQYDKASGLNENYIYTIFRDSKQRLWIATYDKGVNVLDSGKFKSYNAANGFANVKVKCINEDSTGHIYFGTDGQGLFVYDGETFKPIDELERKYIRDIKKDKNGNLWIATAGMGLYKMIASEYKIILVNYTQKNSGLIRDRLNCLHYDKKGGLWYATESGSIGMVFNDKVSDINFNVKDHLPANTIRCMTEDENGYLWVGTDGGLYTIDIYHGDYKIFSYTEERGLTSSNIYLLIFDQNGNLIIGTEKGLDIAEFDKEKRITSVKHYSKGEGFTGVETVQNAVCKDADGTIWFGTINGLSKYNPKNLVKNENAPVTTITDVKLFNKSISETEFKDCAGDWNTITNLNLPYDQNNISFDFAGINFSNPDAVKYQWKLEGSDKDWAPVTEQHAINYSNLGAGHYVFMVKACNEDGVWNKEPIKFAFRISPPIWLRWWFIALVIVIAAAIILVVFRWRVNSIKRKSQEAQNKIQLEKEVMELEQKALRLQMSPHFIFNALNSIQSQIGTDNEQTARYYLAKFSRLMRQILDNSRNATISLEEEINTLENYLLIEKFCNGDRFDYKITLSDSLEKDYIKIPPMLLQPFIENSIKHGMKHIQGKRGRIEVRFEEKNGLLECSVTDNGIGRKKAEEINKNSKETYHRSTALLVTQERLDLLKEGNDGKSLEIIDLYDEKGEPIGTMVLVRIPIG